MESYLRIIGEPKLPSVFLQVLFPPRISLCQELQSVASIMLNIDYRSFVGFLENMAQQMESVVHPISLGSYVMWQRHILMM